MSQAQFDSVTLKEWLPLLPLKEVVIFPRMVVPLLVGRPASIAAIEDCLASGRLLFVCTQVNADVESPGIEDVHKVGVAVNILQTLRMPDGTMKVVIEGVIRGVIRKRQVSDQKISVQIRPIKPQVLRDKAGQALMRTTLDQFEQYVRLSQRIAPEVLVSMRNVDDAETLADLICAYLPLRVDERQELLEIERIRERLEKISMFLMRENDLLEIERKVRDRVREQMEQNQREFYLNEQLKAIHQELGKTEESGDEFAELRSMIEKAGMPRDVEEKALKELSRYQRMPYMSPEGAVIRTYIEWLLDMPWKKKTRDSLDLVAAKNILDEDHYGLTKVKERILEFLAVRKISKSAKGPILCLVGPPGVGKTSLGKSVARAMGRKFVRVSLGGIRDEAEVRGHRRTYVGSMPGRIVQYIKKAGVRNPVFMLDEIDKMSSDFRGDPAAALLEVLDPEQNRAFNDHYLEIDFDLHEVFFITTANNEYDIPHALHDRMEIVRLPGYTGFEKMHIAKLFLVRKQMKEAGLTKDMLEITDDALKRLMERYTCEAGVRELERQIANICRKIARRVVEEHPKNQIKITDADLPALLGPYEYSGIERDLEPQVGVAIGMAWTIAGGDILKIEAITMKGRGALTLTGQLGDVMQESAKAAYSYIRAHADELGIKTQFHRTSDIHVHVPESATPKDGPSAGVAMTISMVSALKQVPPSRFAMTGEITLLGRVLPVGGVKEKVIAVHRAGVRKIVLPKENDKDLVEIPKEVKDDIEFVLVEDVSEVLKLAFPGEQE